MDADDVLTDALLALAKQQYHEALVLCDQVLCYPDSAVTATALAHSLAGLALSELGVPL